MRNGVVFMLFRCFSLLVQIEPNPVTHMHFTCARDGDVFPAAFASLLSVLILLAYVSRPVPKIPYSRFMITCSAAMWQCVATQVTPFCVFVFLCDTDTFAPHQVVERSISLFVQQRLSFAGLHEFMHQRTRPHSRKFLSFVRCIV